MEALRKASDEHGVGVVLVEQHLSQALRIADTVFVVASGRMTLNGPVDEVTASTRRSSPTYWARRPATHRP